MPSKTERLRITEIFYSLQGESRSVGCPTVFVRLTGCPLRCSYCDTAYAFSGGSWLTVDEIVARVQGYPAKYVTVTGGEPLSQKNCHSLMDKLCDLGLDVSLETSGALSVSEVNRRVSRVVDVKTPSSGESDKNLIENYGLLNAHDQIKFVIGDREDYEWSKRFIERNQLLGVCEVWFSCSFDQIQACDLADWILQDGLQVRFQLQIHKVLWADAPGR